MSSTLFIRRYQILAVLCSLISSLLIISFDSSAWRSIESNDQLSFTQFYPPLQYNLVHSHHTDKNQTFILNIGPLWRCLTTKSNTIQKIHFRECAINRNSFDYLIISVGIGTCLVFTILSISIISHCLTSRILIIRICMSFILEFAFLWLIYGFFHVQKVLGPLNGWASIGYFTGTLGILIICVLEWDDCFREIYRSNHLVDKTDQNDKPNIYVSGTLYTDIE